MGYVIVFGIELLIYLIIGICLVVRVHGKCECDNEPFNNEEGWLLLFLWVPLGAYSLWRNGTKGL